MPVASCAVVAGTENILLSYQPDHKGCPARALPARHAGRALPWGICPVDPGCHHSQGPLSLRPRLWCDWGDWQCSNHPICLLPCLAQAGKSYRHSRVHQQRTLSCVGVDQSLPPPILSSSRSGSQGPKVPYWDRMPTLGKMLLMYHCILYIYCLPQNLCWLSETATAASFLVERQRY